MSCTKCAMFQMGKRYDSDEEYSRRLHIFAENMQKIKEFNSRQESYKSWPNSIKINMLEWK